MDKSLYTISGKTKDNVRSLAAFRKPPTRSVVVYLPGTMAYIQENHGSLYETILNTERRLEELWLAFMANRRQGH